MNLQTSRQPVAIMKIKFALKKSLKLIINNNKKCMKLNVMHYACCMTVCG